MLNGLRARTVYTLHALGRLGPVLGIASVLAFSCIAARAQELHATAGAATNEGARVANTGPAQLPGYLLGPGDHIRVTVFGQQDLTGEYAVDGSGDLAFPLIGRIHAGGMTAEQLGHTIESKLSPDYLKNPHTAIEVLTYRPFYIVGEVKTAGGYPYVSGMTVLNAVALAGGFTYRARENSFYVTRTAPDGSKTKVDGDPNTPILPGDIITVRERYF